MSASNRHTDSDDVTTPAYGPCSREQEALWLLEQSRDIGSANNLQVQVELVGSLDVAMLEEALLALTARHPALRTELAIQDGRLASAEHAVGDVALTLIEEPTALDTLLVELSRAPIDPLAWPPLRAFAIRSREARGAGAAPLPDVPSSLRPFLEDDRAEIERTSPLARAYWEPALLRMEDAARLPTGPSAGQSGDARATSVGLTLDPALRDRVRRLAEAAGVSLFTTLLAARQLVQHRYAGGGEGGVATAVAMDARPAAMRDAVGMFANEAPLYTTLDESTTMLDHLAHVGRGLSALLELRRFPFSEARTRFCSDGDPRDPVAQVGITYYGARRASRRWGISTSSLSGRWPRQPRGARSCCGSSTTDWRRRPRRRTCGSRRWCGDGSDAERQKSSVASRAVQ